MELIISCTEGRNQGISGDEELRDIFVLRNTERDLFRITFISYLDNGVDSMRVEKLGDIDAEAIPGVYGGIDLGYKTHSWLMLMLDRQQGEFFADMFVDELGRSREYGITFC
jgi:hypothetical protein